MTLITILDTHRNDILRLWMQAVRPAAPETQGLSDGALLSTFPLLVHRLGLASLRAGIATVLDLHRAILDHGNLAAGQMALNETDFPLDELLATSVQVVRALATFKGIGAVQDLAVGATVRTDKVMLQQV